MLLSCDKFWILSLLRPPECTVYSIYTYAEQTIFAIHQTFSEQNSYRGRFLPWYGFNTDIEWYIAAKPSDKLGIVAYDTKPTKVS